MTANTPSPFRYVIGVERRYPPAMGVERANAIREQPRRERVKANQCCARHDAAE